VIDRPPFVPIVGGVRGVWSVRFIPGTSAVSCSPRLRETSENVVAYQSRSFK
jgi:hypothetical protein